MSEETKVKEAFEHYLNKLRGSDVKPNDMQIYVLKHAFYEGVEAMLYIVADAGVHGNMLRAADLAITELAEFHYITRKRHESTRVQ